jgi:hypothetical protein
MKRNVMLTPALAKQAVKEHAGWTDDQINAIAAATGWNIQTILQLILTYGPGIYALLQAFIPGLPPLPVLPPVAIPPVTPPA